MKHVLCTTVEEAKLLAEEINRELGFPKVHVLGVDAVLTNPGRARERLEAAGAIKTESGIEVSLTALDEPVVILETEIAVLATGSLASKVQIVGYPELKANKVIVLEPVLEEEIIPE